MLDYLYIFFMKIKMRHFASFYANDDFARPGATAHSTPIIFDLIKQFLRSMTYGFTLYRYIVWRRRMLSSNHWKSLTISVSHLRFWWFQVSISLSFSFLLLSIDNVCVCFLLKSIIMIFGCLLEIIKILLGFWTVVTHYWFKSGHNQ